ncbi:hypothetical protein [Oceanobacillus sp. J11TS1]|uniref:hypothetical protein n=1 Tax=Oceanobacillus sp. J11TS1 TaxID=2807191 RepID=UPI001B2F8438|nr:hypothetical protein [Oceanobacillus sp. J11TS1]GIO22416.1 hypothetical protein J11TS1_09970 [Oceanobacillus sp. J11TS1]
MKSDGNSLSRGLTELYIFSNESTPPVKEFREGINSEYVELSTHLNPEVSAAPSYTGTPEHEVNEIDRFKRDLINHYDFVHVYKLDHVEYDPGNDALGTKLLYMYSHKEFNLKGERKIA